MILWVDSQLSPSLAPWITQTFGFKAASVERLGFKEAKEQQIFDTARTADAVVITKDQDFVLLLGRLGPPPKVIWIRCGNTSSAALRQLLVRLLPRAIEMLAGGESLVEIIDREEHS